MRRAVYQTGLTRTMVDDVPKPLMLRTRSSAGTSAQIWATVREWLREGGCIPDSRDLEMDLTGPLYGFDVNNAIEIEKKSDMKKRRVVSPDDWNIQRQYRRRCGRSSGIPQK